MATINRQTHLDVLKSFSIIGVIFIHGGMLIGCNSFVAETLAHLFRFCVPVFIIIWAYFLEKSLQKNSVQSEWQIILKKTKHLFIVFLLWSILYFILLANLKTLTLSTLITQHFSGYGWAGQYYFIILFQLILLFPFLRKIYLNKVLCYVITTLIICLYLFSSFYPEYFPSTYYKLGDRPFYLWIPYVFAGIGLARNEFIKINRLLAFSILLIPLEYYLFDIESPYIRISILVSTILLVVSFIQHPFTIKNNAVNSFFNLIGSNTMTLFIANPLIMITFEKVTNGYKLPCTNIFHSICGPILSVTLITALCLVIAYAIKKIKLDGIIN